VRLRISGTRASQNIPVFFSEGMRSGQSIFLPRRFASTEVDDKCERALLIGKNRKDV